MYTMPEQQRAAFYSSAVMPVISEFVHPRFPGRGASGV